MATHGFSILRKSSRNRFQNYEVDLRNWQIKTLLKLVLNGPNSPKCQNSFGDFQTNRLRHPCVSISSIFLRNCFRLDKQSGAVEACWAHNPEVRGSKPRSANLTFKGENLFFLSRKVLKCTIERGISHSRFNYFKREFLCISALTIFTIFHL